MDTFLPSKTLWNLQNATLSRSRRSHSFIQIANYVSFCLYFHAIHNSALFIAWCIRSKLSHFLYPSNLKKGIKWVYFLKIYVIGRGRRERPHWVYVFLLKITSQIDWAMYVCLCGCSSVCLCKYTDLILGATPSFYFPLLTPSRYLDITLSYLSLQAFTSNNLN